MHAFLNIPVLSHPLYYGNNLKNIHQLPPKFTYNKEQFFKKWFYEQNCGDTEKIYLFFYKNIELFLKSVEWENFEQGSLEKLYSLELWNKISLFNLSRLKTLIKSVKIMWYYQITLDILV